MNLFRSEEHARNWAGFGPEDGLVPLEKVMAYFSSPVMRERMNGKYVTHLAEYYEETTARRRAVLGGNPFWFPA